MLLTLGMVAFLSILGIYIGMNTSVVAGIKGMGLLNTFLPFVLLFIPLATFAYFRGAISGLFDKARGMGELDFSCW